MSRTELVVVLLYMSVVQVHNYGKVSCSPTYICAVKGSTVEITCSLPVVVSTDVKEISWFTRWRSYNPVDLATEANYAGRVKYSCEQERCTLTIRNLKLTDSAKYYFLLKYHQHRTYSNEVTLSVTDVKVKVNYPTQVECDSSCEPPRPSYIWYKNGQKTSQTRASHSVPYYRADSYSCALRGSKDFPSPSTCVSGAGCNRVTYTDRRVCALRGSSVEISCSYNSNNYDVESKLWFRRGHSQHLVDIREDPQYSGRVEFLEPETRRSTLRITNLTESDSAEYLFKFKARWFDWGSDLPGTTLTVTDVRVEVLWYFSLPKLKCETRCHVRDGTSYVWFKNGQKIQGESSYLYSLVSYNPWDSYSCAVKGFEDFTSPALCVSGESCNSVTYPHRRICAFKGSSVDISCSYSSYHSIQSKFWFRPDSSLYWQNPLDPVDLREDPQYSGRVEFLEPETRRSTLRITDLTESDSAEYRFKFRTGQFDWGSDLPGTSLTVTAVQLQVSRVIGAHQSHAETKLKCVSSCSPTGLFIFVWFKNGEKVQEETSSSYTGNFGLGDNISCALKGYEDHRSASVYAPKLPSVSVSPSPEIVEGSSVTLTCSSDANPAAELTWYKEEQTLKEGPQFVFTNIHSSDSGEYHCLAENQLGRRSSNYVFINVTYAPKTSDLSVSRSAEIVEGSSVTLTCSSDANPAASYTWYKENQTLRQGPEGVYHFSSISSEDRGTYHCKSENQFGHID
ncbi:hypothetical protein INR49_020793 [Caranx melampygus]|nr:hypothetical protein INR49_020793 [Caranx melampygus]